MKSAQTTLKIFRNRYGFLLGFGPLPSPGWEGSSQVGRAQALDLLIGRVDQDRAPAKQSLLRWPCPLPSDRAIPDLLQNLESKV